MGHEGGNFMVVEIKGGMAEDLKQSDNDLRIFCHIERGTCWTRSK